MRETKVRDVRIRGARKISGDRISEKREKMTKRKR